MKINWSKKLWVHVALWCTIYSLMFFTLSNSFGVAHGFHRSSQLVLAHGVIFYVNLFYFSPRFFEQKKYMRYFLSVALLIGVLTWFLHEGSMFSGELPERIGEVSREFVRKLRRNGDFPLKTNSPFYYLRVIQPGLTMLGTLFLSMVFRNFSEQQRKDRTTMQLENRLLEAESKMLKYQLNPHFLFNALNNIYSLAHAKSDRTPEFVHKLSMLLSYVLYECDTEKVELGREVEYIESFVEFQLLKDDQLDNVKVELGKIDLNLKVAPLILISFIENCFKHSNFESRDDSWISISIETRGSQLYFKSSNSIPKVRHEKNALGGVGMENVKKRLEMIYPERHKLEIVNGDLEYSVELMIDLDEA